MNDDYKKGLIAFRDGRFQDAIDVFSLIVTNDSKNSAAWHALGASYAKINKIPEAFNCILRSTVIEPDNEKYQKSLSSIRKKLEEFTKTTEYQEKYVDRQRIDWGNTVAFFGKGIIWLILFIFALYLIVNVSIPLLFSLTGLDNPTSKYYGLPSDQIYSKSQSIPYERLLRYPDSYQGSLIRIDGQVKQVNPINKEYAVLIVATRPLGEGLSSKLTYFDDYVYVHYTGKSYTTILEDDVVTIYGEYKGRITYDTIIGSKNTVPEVIAVQVENSEPTPPKQLIDEIDKIEQATQSTNLQFDGYIYGDWNNNQQVENLFFNLMVPDDKSSQNLDEMKISYSLEDGEPIQLNAQYDNNVINPGEKQKITVNLQGMGPKSNQSFIIIIKTKDDKKTFYTGKIHPEYSGGVITNYYEDLKREINY